MDFEALRRDAARALHGLRGTIASVVARVSVWVRARLARQPRSNRSLLGRLLTLLLVGVIMIYLLAVAGLWWTGGALMSDSLHKQAVQWLAEFDQLGTPLYVGRPGAQHMQTVAARLRRSPEVAFVRYYDDSGTRVLGDYTVGVLPPALTAADKKRAIAVAASEQPYSFSKITAAPTYVRIIAPMRVRSFSADGVFKLGGGARESVQVIGYVDFGLDPGYYHRDFRRSMLLGSIAIALVFAGIFFLGRRLIKRALAPLIALQEPLAHVLQGETEVRIGSGGDREIATVRDALNTILTALRQREQALEHAERDTVTGVSNRAYLVRQLEHERQQLAHNGASAAVLAIVLDRYTKLRKELGPVVGDRLLSQAAALLRAHIREDDVIARHGTDRFAVLVRNVSREGAVKVASAMARVIQEFQFSAGERSYPVSAKIGIATFDSERLSADAILAQAEAACVQARTPGGSGIGVHRSDEGDDGRRGASAAGWAVHIRDAIRDNRFRLVYQSIVPLQDRNQPECYEVLLRLGTSGGEFVAPAAFLPIANRSGLLSDVDYWVIREAFAALARFRQEGREARFFINLSGQVFDDGDKLVQVVGAELDRQRLPGSAVVFEITEQVAVRQFERARAILDGVHGLQCRFALDDFGSGFSSLSYLKHLPVSFIKMSGAFMQNITAAPTDEIVVKSIIQIARTLGKQTIAESVQDRNTLRLLTTLGADFAQGYFVGRPSAQLPPRPPSGFALAGGALSGPK